MSTTAETSATGGKQAFFFVIVCVTLDMLAFGMIVPVMPDLLMELTQLPAEQAVAWAGPLTATFAIVNFLAMPTIGGLSDRFGRRPVLLASIATLAVDFLIMGFANSLWMLFLGRALSGASSATLSTANAYIADTTTPEDRGRAFGMIGAAFGIGFVLGPAFGGLLGMIDARAPFFAAAAVAGINFLYGCFVLPESLRSDRKRRFELVRANPFGAFAHFAKLPRVSWFLIGSGILALAASVYPSTWSFHGEIRYAWGPREIGLSLAFVGATTAIVQWFLMEPILKRLGLTRTVLLGLSVQATAMTCFAFAGAAWLVYPIIAFSAFAGVGTPSLNTIMSNLTPEDAQGELHAASATLNALAISVAPVILTQTLYYFASGAAPVYFPGAAFLLGALLVLCALVPVVIGIRTNQGNVEASPDKAA
ncbi:MAG: TCR/Tet family MFS transporter [Pseudomonadota bacterium]